jgi:hypothetical protein
MSRNNGDRARYNRQRKEKIHKKARSREQRKLLQTATRVPELSVPRSGILPESGAFGARVG